MTAKLRDAGTDVLFLVLLIGGATLWVWLGIPWGYCIPAILLPAVGGIALIVLRSVRFPVHRTCRRERVTVAEVEAEFVVRDDESDAVRSLFSLRQEHWLRLLDQVEEEDELWKFCSPPETWDLLCGRAGIVLVRNGKSVDHILTALN